MVAGKRHVETVTTDAESCSSPDQPKSRFNFEILKMTQKANRLQPAADASATLLQTMGRASATP
jgi:hypothetical protein